MKFFDAVRITKPKSNVFDLSHEKKLSLNMGDLVPIYVQDYLPGDKFQVNTEMLMRMAPMVAPVMHRCNVYIHFFSVANRLVWNEWETFITGGEDGKQTPVFPTIPLNQTYATAGLLSKGTLLDYMGLPTWTSGVSPTITNPINISALPFRAYQMIYNEYYRDQNLRAKVDFAIGGSTATDASQLLTLRKRCWEKDYFTSALPWTQRGDTVVLPSEHQVNYATHTHIRYENDEYAGAGNLQTDAGGNLLAGSGPANAYVENIDSINEQLTINDLRRAQRLQQWLEKNARGGSRYIENILHHFGVKSSDARLQRPEYLGGGKAPIVISEVLSTVDSETVPQGNMAGHGLSVGNTNSFTKYFEEHGYIIGIMSVLPRTAYQQGVERHFIKQDKLDYYWPSFANIGEQPVYQGEVWHKWDSSGYEDMQTFGYQSRYAEYKYKQSTVHGDFRDNLSHWHMGRIFSNAPALNNTFVESNPTDRIFAVNDSSHKLYVQLYNNVKAIRPIPYFDNPSF